MALKRRQAKTTGKIEIRKSLKLARKWFGMLSAALRRISEYWAVGDNFLPISCCAFCTVFTKIYDTSVIYYCALRIRAFSLASTKPKKNKVFIVLCPNTEVSKDNVNFLAKVRCRNFENIRARFLSRLLLTKIRYSLRICSICRKQPY